ncbi:MAG: hypothetical protein DDT31_01330 [Syntrophomonadaceae bacterium]|nr:hypothetical protein [Bacillota bacterium]
MTGNKGLKGYERFPANFIGVHWLLAVMILVSVIVLLIGFVVMQSEKQSEIRKGFMSYCVEQKQKRLGSDMRMSGVLVAECEKDWERIKRSGEGQRGKEK